MKRVLKILGIVFGSVLALCFFIYVVCFIFCYKFVNITSFDYKKLTNNIYINDTVNIKNKSVSNYMNLGDVKFRNDFSKFERVSSSSNDGYSYKYKDKDKKRMVYFNFSTLNISSCSKDNDECYNFIKNGDIEKVKNAKIKDANFNIVNIINNLETYYNATYYLRGDVTNYSYITGDYEGVIIDNHVTKLVVLYNKDKMYEFNFNGNGYFSDDYIYDFISTVVFL